MDEAVDCLAMDGRIVRIRPARPGDGPALLAMHQRLSPRSRHLRFFSAGAALEPEVHRLLRPAGPDHRCLLAEDCGIVVGVGSYERIAGEQAEFALLVADERHGEGLGTLLLEHLAATARRDGITELIGEVLPENAAMLRVSGDLAPGVARRFVAGAGAVRVCVPTLPDEAALAAVAARDRTAEHRSLRPLLAPASVAVIGAGRRAGGAGPEVLAGLRDGGYTGALYAVDPHAGQVGPVAAVPSVARIPGRVDLAVVAVPAGDVPDAIARCAAAGVRVAVVLTGGIPARERAGLVRTARAHGMRIVGPDCLGVINTDPAVRLDAAVGLAAPAPGGLAVATQSGAVGVAILQEAARCGAGVSSFVSLGDKADVSGNDLLAYWYDDPATRAVALYLESFGNPRRFAWTARALSRRKPVLAVKSGRRAGASPGAPDAAVSALFAQAGVVRTDTLGELLDAARVLVDQPLPDGVRLAVLGNAGGLNALAVDAADTAALTLPARVGGAANPADLDPGATPGALAAAVRAAARPGEADLLLVTVVATRTNDWAALLHAAAAVLDDAPRLPAAMVVVGAEGVPPSAGRRRVPVFTLPEPAVHALGRAAGYAAWRRAPIGHRPRLAGIDAGRARAVVDAALAAGGGRQPAATARRLLEAYGITLLDTGEPAAATAREPAPPGPGVELVAGVVHDPLLGSLVMLGPGDGPPGERMLRLPPVTDRDAPAMWRALRGAPRLTGDRGAPSAGTAALEDLLLRLGRLAEDRPEVAELTLDPVLAGPDGCTAAAVRLRLAAVGPEPEPYGRQLPRHEPAGVTPR